MVTLSRSGVQKSRLALVRAAVSRWKYARDRRSAPLEMKGTSGIAAVAIEPSQSFDLSTDYYVIESARRVLAHSIHVR